MKKCFLLFAFALRFLTSCAPEETTTYYLIRHAEKDRTDTTNRNPTLNKDGLKRADNWATHFKNIALEAIYSTKYNRTLQTASPTAAAKNLPVLNYDPRNLFSDTFQKATKGKTVLVVGHSNTTPEFVNKILGKKEYQNMDDHDNARLFKVTLKGDERTCIVEKIASFISLPPTSYVD
jgi:broad specificity phosphatase PhoE